MKWTENTALKALVFLLAAAMFTAAAGLGWYQLANLNALWGDPAKYGPADSKVVSDLEEAAASEIFLLLETYNAEDQGNAIGVYNQREKARLEEKYDRANTNLRWQALDENGKVKFGNTRNPIPEDAMALYWTGFVWNARHFQVGKVWSDWREEASGAANVNFSQVTVTFSEDWREELRDAWAAAMAGNGTDTESSSDPGAKSESGADAGDSADQVDWDMVYLDADGCGALLIIEERDGARYVFSPTVRAMMEPNQFGFVYSLTGNGWQETSSAESATENLQLALWLDENMAAADEYAQAVASIEGWRSDRVLWLGGTVAFALAGALFTVFLCCGAGHKKGVEGISLHWFHALPGDLTAAAGLTGAVLLLALADEAADRTDFSLQTRYAAAAGIAALAAALCLGLVVTFAARCKAGTVLRNTWTFRLCRWGWRLFVKGIRFAAGCLAVCRDLIRAMPLIWKVIVCGLCYLLATAALFDRWTGLWLIGSGIALLIVCLWSLQWKRIRQGTKEIVGGNPEYHIDTNRMFSDLKSHAEQLNSLGQSISLAVEERLRSERFKAELITNVSHDLKTPLTSIINYVDLLKKENIDSPKAREYIEVLDRKSQRLKKLTEDLVEASKASTGNLAVQRERVGLSQLADQALAEYEDRLQSQGLSVIRVFPEEEVWILADGRHLWRVLDNLLGNCAKYALAGTRIYVEVKAQAGHGVLSVKNISRDPLNVPPQALLERFARGEESRTTEGSGLGLSIAQSLTELQQGAFCINIDGDLFKAIVSLPLQADGISRNL